MTKKQSIQLFNDRKIRTAWDDKEEKWITNGNTVSGPIAVNISN